jgi:predicted nucleic acid-binding protein
LAEDEDALPTGPEHVCCDATVLICYQDNGHLDTLRDIFPNQTLTAHVITGWELVKSQKAIQMNKGIVGAGWLRSVRVTDPDDLDAVRRLLAFWAGGADKNDGEAEVIVLCKRYGWVAILDDLQGRQEALARGLHIAYMSTMLIAAAALGVNGLDADSAWDIHRAVESQRTRPRLQNEALFKRLVEIFRHAWEQSGEPAWPAFLCDRRLDKLVDQADPL